MAEASRPGVVLPGDLLARYRRFSLYNSPYAAHDRGHAVDLYPEPGTAPSPVTGEVIDTRTVSAPPKPYAEDDDHLILIAVESGVEFHDASEDAPGGNDVEGSGGNDRDAPGGNDGGTRGDGDDGRPVARVLHVDPAVEPGEWVTAGEDLGRTIRSGFFAPWVGDHLHVGFRPPGVDPYRASGSVRVTADAAVGGLAWDGRGTVVERGDTYVLLDRPAHPAPGREWAGIAADGGGVLDGGLPHYDGGGLLDAAPDGSGAVALLGTDVGVRGGGGDGRTVEWADCTVTADGTPVTGLSLYVGRDRAGAKVVCPDADFDVGSELRVRIRRTPR